MADTLLKVDGITKRFGGVLASDAITLSVPAGELHAIIGPNGAGKTTLIGQLTGEIMPNSGTHLLRRRGHHHAADLRALDDGARALVPDHLAVSAISPRSTMSRSRCRRMPATRSSSGKSARKEAELRAPARAALDRVGLCASRRHLVSSISHGEHRQLEIAMALATKPRMLLLDEPMAGMGPEESARLVKTLLELKKQYTILLIEHDMEAVFALADRISVLVYGRVIATGLPDEIRANADVRQAYLGEQEARAWLTRCSKSTASRPATAAARCCSGCRSSIAAGEMVTLMGRNGMGKTTTVRSIMGLTPARAGTIRFGEQGYPRLAVLSRGEARRRPRAGRPADFPESHGAREPGRDRGQYVGRSEAVDL